MKFIENSETQQRLKAKILFLTRYTQERDFTRQYGSEHRRRQLPLRVEGPEAG